MPVPDPDPRPPIQGVPRVETTADDPVGGGAEGDRKVEVQVEDPGPSCRRELQPGGTRLPLHERRCLHPGSVDGGLSLLLLRRARCLGRGLWLFWLLGRSLSGRDGRHLLDSSCCATLSRTASPPLSIFRT